MPSMIRHFKSNLFALQFSDIAVGRKVSWKGWGKVAGEPGFEPGLTESESVGLPLTYSPTELCFARTRRGGAVW